MTRDDVWQRLQGHWDAGRDPFADPRVQADLLADPRLLERVVATDAVLRMIGGSGRGEAGPKRRPWPRLAVRVAAAAVILLAAAVGLAVRLAPGRSRPPAPPAPIMPAIAADGRVRAVRSEFSLRGRDSLLHVWHLQGRLTCQRRAAVVGVRARTESPGTRSLAVAYTVFENQLR